MGGLCVARSRHRLARVIHAMRTRLSWQSVGALCLLFALNAVALVLLLDAISSQKNAANYAQRAEQAVAASSRLERLVVDMESGVRGYLLTGANRFLDPYRKALVLAPTASGTLVETATTARTQGMATDIQRHIDSYVNSYLRPLIALSHKSPKRAQSVVETGEGKDRVDALRGMFSSFDRAEQRLADQHRAAASSSSASARTITIAALALVALLCLAMGLYLQFRILRPVGELAWSAKRVATGDLGARVQGIRSRNELGEMGVSFNEMATALERSWRAAQEADRVKEEFFALVSHELRTPLSSIVGYVELLLEESEDGDLTEAERQRFLAIVDRNARRLQRLVGDLLFVARLEAGKLDLQLTDVDLSLTAREAIDTARQLADREGISLHEQIAAGLSMHGDGDRLGQVIDNLLSNALKFTPDGGEVGLRLFALDGNAQLEVWDTGIGIPATEQPRLFERFFRASSATDAAVPGVGLGLSITKAIVESHGGRLSFTSEEGRGTTFRVHLPLGSNPS
jgi:signal transduction histidine kinase